MNAQNLIWYEIDYYEIICIFLLATLSLFALFSYSNRTILPSPKTAAAFIKFLKSDYKLK